MKNMVIFDELGAFKNVNVVRIAHNNITVYLG